VYTTIELERRGAGAIIRLNRPQALNAWNATLGDELLDAVRAVAADDAVRAVCVTGAGRAFSSGADLRDLTSRPRTAAGQIDVHTALTTVYHPILGGLRTMAKPVLAAINGPAVGIGCSLALSCDLLVAAATALEWGLVDEVLPDDGFEDGVHALLDRLAAGPTRAYAGSKRQINGWLYAGLEDQLALEARIQQEMAATGDFAEGVAAFLHKREPDFGGR
jgi:2-(1,2-epoxy-1,2-dihydrophenyl)acetyl-CoA isomerase